MRDQLEQFIKKNRAAFDDAEPDVKFWNNIQKGIEPAGPAKILRLWAFARVAAVALLLLGVGAVAGSYFTKSNYADSQLALQGFSEEFAEVEAYYVNQIEYKLTQVKSFNQSEPVLKDMETLDKEFNNLRARLDDDVPDEMIMSAMINNYKTKIRILERVLSRIEKSEKEKTKRNEEINL